MKCSSGNDRADIAVLAGAGGVHVGQDDLPPSAVRRIGPDLLIGLSTHSASQVRAAARTPVHYRGGPVVQPSTKEPSGFAARFRGGPGGGEA
ncbi:MAG: thiamine phosphate synthase, partial [Myxococcota bacterium]|nr:thiamine phosphate synthase [Myxococcota bacterium]